MSLDIYGHYLKPGYCSVHPWHYEEFPCSICDQEHTQFISNIEEIKKRIPSEIIETYIDNKL